MSYLMHFNKNHSSKDGRFVSGDGDGDGQVNDRANRGKHPESKVYKTKSGKEVKYVSPNGLKKGYWADAKTNKRLIGRTLFKAAPSEFRGKEFAKTMFYVGASQAIAGANEASKRYVEQYNNDRIKSSAKSVGGDW